MMLLVNGYCYGSKGRSPESTEEALDNIKEAKDFDSIGQNTQRHDNDRHKQQKWVESCKYCRLGASPETVPCLQQDLQWKQKDQPPQGGVKVNAKTAARPKTIQKTIHDIRQDEEALLLEQEM